MSSREYIQNSTQKIWDPAGDDVIEKNFTIDNEEIQKQLNFHKTHPFQLKMNWWLLFFSGFIGSGILFIEKFHSDDLIRKLNFILVFLFLFWCPFFLYIFKIKSLQKTLIGKIIADKYHWIYSPKPKNSRWLKLYDLYPVIFDHKTPLFQNLLLHYIKHPVISESSYGALFNGTMENEFWGNFSNKQQFYSGIAHCEYTQSGKHIESYFQTVFAIQLNKILQNSLTLIPKRKLDQILGINKTIGVESIDFNNIFKIKINGQNTDPNTQIEIFKKLSPTVQINLVSLSREFPECSIYFSKDVLFFVKKGFLFTRKKLPSIFKVLPSPIYNSLQLQMKSNFFHKVELNKLDELYLQDKLEKLTSIASEIPKYLD